MADLLSAEERSALQAPFAAPEGADRRVEPAIFPSAGQLDPERTAALTAITKRWLDAVCRELSRQLRTPCAPSAPLLQSVACDGLPAPDESAFWGAIDGGPDCYLLLSLPRRFAALVCERSFGAPLQLPEERDLTPAEFSLLREMTRAWLGFLTHVLKQPAVRACAAPEPERLWGETGVSSWMRFTSDLVCGPVEGRIHLSMPPSSARRLLGEGAAADASACSPENMLARLATVPLELRAVLGQTQFTVDELASLRVGDVIALDRRSPDPVEIFIGQRLLCRARAGLSGDGVALEVIEESREEGTP
jgi:flagellar motor switch protein FliM